MTRSMPPGFEDNRLILESGYILRLATCPRVSSDKIQWGAVSTARERGE